MLKRAWLWVAAVGAAIVGVVLLVLTGRRKAPVVLPPPPPDRPDTPPVDKPLVVLKPADEYHDQKAPALGPPSAVIARINTRHD
jgi:hypothetical protein